MKITAAILVCSLVGVSPALVMGTTIAQWNFDASTLPSSGTSVQGSTLNGPDYNLGSGVTAFHNSSSTSWTSPVGNGSPNSFSANNWGVGDYFQFQVSTAGYMDITVNWDQVSSATGPGTFELLWSTDGGSFTPLGSYYSVLGTSSTWSASLSHQGYSFTNDLSSIANLNNASTVYFQLVDESTANAAGTGAVGTSGTDRIDNFTVTGTQIPDSMPTLAGLGCVLGLLAALRRMSPVSGPLPLGTA